ncbi:MAG: NAD-dependent epimerase/dehydratase family protein [Myxococcota bacterium]|jgi:dihydroflavonol-4-reductase|nr:NAD-dependent epimerase/dehydratase family protein [Myxococcota bacterium]
MARVLVTGANGLLGGHLVRELLAQGHQVNALVRPTSDTQTLAGLDVERFYGDVRDRASFRKAADGCELIYHCAAVFSYWGYSLEEMQSTARQGSEVLVDVAQDAGVKRVVLTSSTAVLGGSPAPRLLDESARLSADEVPDYFRSKVLQEEIALTQARLKKMDMVCTLPGIIVGPYDFRPSASLATITTYLQDPLKLTFHGGASLVHAQDVARGHILVAEKGSTYEGYILAAENFHWAEIHRQLSQAAGTWGPGFQLGKAMAVSSAGLMEFAAKTFNKTPMATRDLAQQVGSYFWYSSQKTQGLGYHFRSLEETLVDTLAWLCVSKHLKNRQKDKLLRQNFIEKSHSVHQ